MLEVCYSDSIKAAIRVAQITDPSDSGGAFAIIGGSFLWRLLHPFELRRRRRRFEHERRELMELMVPLESKREDIAGLSFELSYGDIASAITDGDCPRRHILNEMLTADPWGELGEMQGACDMFWQGCMADLKKLETRAAQGEDVRIWVDDTPASLCGLLFTAELLHRLPCRVTLARAPKSFIKPDGEVIEYRGWGDIPPELYGKFAEVGEELSKKDLETMAKGWQALKKKNAPLRVTENKTVINAGADHYDRLILSFVEDNTKVAMVIGRTLGEGKAPVGDWLIAERIKAMLQSGRLLMVREDPRRFYSSVIKKA